MKPKIKAPGTNLLTLKYDEPLSNFAFNFNLRHYSMATAVVPAARTVGRCRLTVSKPVSKPPPGFSD
jgi:hypothetical protein